jgi:hypothetical protein
MSVTPIITFKAGKCEGEVRMTPNVSQCHGRTALAEDAAANPTPDQRRSSEDPLLAHARLHIPVHGRRRYVLQSWLRPSKLMLLLKNSSISAGGLDRSRPTSLSWTCSCFPEIPPSNPTREERAARHPATLFRPLTAESTLSSSRHHRSATSSGCSQRPSIPRARPTGSASAISQSEEWSIHFLLAATSTLRPSLPAVL